MKKLLLGGMISASIFAGAVAADAPQAGQQQISQEQLMQLLQQAQPSITVDEALKDPQFDVFIITADGESAGGTIIKKEGEGRYSLDLLFIFKEFLNKKIGTRAWQAIEAHYPDAVVWETFTPYFERRNIHFYLHKCHFRIVEFFSEFHREEHDLTEEFKDVNTSGFFRFEKIMDHSKEPR